MREEDKKSICPWLEKLTTLEAICLAISLACIVCIILSILIGWDMRR
jgi:hypothetical protein